MATKIRGITIEIGGDASGFEKSLREVNKSIKDTQSQLKDVNKLLKLDPNSTDLLRQKQTLLKDAIKETNDKLKLLKDEQKTMDQNGVDKNSEQYMALQREIINTEKNLKDLETQAVKSSSAIAAITKVGEGMKTVGDGMQRAGKALAPVSAAASAGIGFAVKEAADFDAQMSKVQAISGASTEQMEALRAKAREMGAATKFSAEEAGEGLEYMAMAGWKTDQMLEGIQPILNLAAASGEELGTTSDIVTDALTAFGLQAEDAGHFADILAAASSNANTNVSMMGESFKYAAPVAGALGYSAEDVAVALGLMANAGIKSSQAGTSLRNIFQRMAKPTKESEMAMKRLGLSMADDEGNMYSFMEIMEQIRDSMGNIKMPMEEYEKQLDYLDGALEAGSITQKQYTAAVDELNMQTFGAEGAEKARAAAMLGGARAMSALLAISNASEADFEKLSSAVSNSSQQFAQLADGSIVPMNEALASGQEIIATYNGEAEKMSAIMLNNLPGALTILKSGISELAISIGESLMPYIMVIVAKMQELVNWFNGLDSAQKTLIAGIGVVVAALAPLLVVLGVVISSVGTVLTSVGSVAAFIKVTLIPAITAISAPVLAVIAVITGIIAVLVLLYNTNEDFRNKVNAIWETIKQIITRAVELIQAAIQKFTQVAKAVWSRWGDSILAYAKSIWNFIYTEISVAITLIQDVLNIVLAAINGDWTAVWSGIKKFAEDLWNGIKAIVEAAVNVVKTKIESALTIIKDLWTMAWTAIKDKLSEIWNTIKSTVETMVNGIKEKIGSIKDTIMEKVGAAVDWLKNLPGEALDWGRDMIENFVDGIKGAAGDAVDAVKGVGRKIKNFIGFSEPDEGPLSDFHTYAPDMMQLFAKGIRDNLGLVTNAMNDVAGTVAGGVNRAAMVNVTSNTFLNGRLIASEINHELGAML